MGLALNVAAYHYYGLTGLGVSFALWYAVYNVIVGVVYFVKYCMKLHGRAIAMAGVAVAMSVGCALLVEREAYVAAFVLTVVASAFCLRCLLSQLRGKSAAKT